MHILILTYQGFIAGSTFSVYYLARGLAQKGHKVYVGCKEEELLYDLLEPTQVRQIAVPFKSKLDFKSIQIVKDLVETRDIEVINAQASIDRYVSMAIKKIYYPNVKVVHTRRQRPNSSGGSLHGKLYSWGTDKIVAVSSGVKQEIRERMAISNDHIKVIHNGTPREKYQNAIETSVRDLEEKFEITSNDRVIGCVSRHKKQEQLIKALKRIQDYNIKTIFVGINRNEIELSKEEFPDKHELYFTGEIDPEEALRYYKLFDIHVLPSVTEGLSQSLLEAMYMEVPIIATDAMGNPDLIVHNHTGLLFDDNDINLLADYIDKIFKNAQIAKKFIQNAKQRLEDKFTIERVIDNYEKFFQNLITS